jgi:hypothetical protein
MNSSGVTFMRDGAAIRSRPDCAFVYLLGLVVLMSLREGHRRVRIARAGDTGEMHASGDAGVVELVPPPAHAVDELYRLLSAGERPRWWNPLRWLAKPPAAVPACWSGTVEARFGEARVPIACDLMAYPDGVSIVLEFGGTDAERAEYARAAEAATTAWRERVRAAGT